MQKRIVLLAAALMLFGASFANAQAATPCIKFAYVDSSTFDVHE